MNVFILQMFLLVGIFLCFSVVFLSGGKKSILYISSGDGTQRDSTRRMVRRSAPMSAELIVFALLGLACGVGLYLTHFNLCVFLAYWMPNLNTNLIRGFCGLS